MNNLRIVQPLLLWPRKTFNAQGVNFWSWSKPPPGTFSLVQPTQTIDSLETCKREVLKTIPEHIKKPPYFYTGKVLGKSLPTQPVIWSQENIIKIRESCMLARKVLGEISKILEPGISTNKIDELARELILIHNGYPSPLNFQGYPKSTCTSVNNIAAHGIPDRRLLESGDILSIDVTVYLDGFHGDCSETFLIGDVDEYGITLANVTKECVEKGIEACGPGKWIRGIGHVIHKHARKYNCTVVPIFLGHGIGDFVHGPPDIYHCLNNYPGRMEPGMIFTVGPVISEGDRRVKILSDGWSAITMDNSRTAQIEHTVLITDTGYEVLTK